MLYDDFSVEAGSTNGLVGARGTDCTRQPGALEGEARVAHCFTDQWDDDSDDPCVDLSYYDLLKVWSTFDQPGESAECGPDGRNIQDFRERFQALAPLYGLAEAATYDLPR